MSALRALLTRVLPSVEARAYHCGDYYCYTEQNVIAPGRSCYTTWCGHACSGDWVSVSHYCQ
ncbi:hypothetical protein [Microbispora sp. ATCC PTA-5024]|uniref:hypothetical protein n=1 Tax=Microbispora sp. ATCC PTA-5024 TaxID=316330 RepID=UPI0003DDC281|nr:hypothetical protein [Microbispora sp. ATCC PTA-5024]ETK38160.1 hypothetical protein MPTA5024_00210 [Microbispora sp. ATCC PTA-5024]